MTTESAITRPATRHDIPALLELYTYLHPNVAKPSDVVAARAFDRFLAYDGSAIFVSFVEGKLVSSCTLVVVPNLTRGATAYALIENVVTHPDFRKRGLGKRVLSAAVAAAWAAGCYKVMLMTGATSPETLGFYLGAGFEQSKTGFQMRRP